MMPQRATLTNTTIRGCVMTDLSADIAALPDKSLLVLDDDAPLRTRLGRALEQRGFEPVLVGSVAEALAAVRTFAPAYAVLDMRLEDGTGLKVVEAVRDARPDADDVARALLARKDESPPPPENPMSADRVRWEHIQRVYELCGHNVSETARRLNMHRRTLQRILAKRAPR